MADITQSQDVVKAVGAIAKAYRKAKENGWQLDDVYTFTNESVVNAVVEGVRGSDQIPGEITDIDFREIMELLQSAANESDAL